MDLNLLRSIITVVSFVLFVGICIWTWQGKRKQAFDEAAMLPFQEEMPSNQGGRHAQ